MFMGLRHMQIEEAQSRTQTHSHIHKKTTQFPHSFSESTVNRTYLQVHRERDDTHNPHTTKPKWRRTRMLAGSTFVISVASCSAVVDNGRLLHRRRPLITMLASRETRCNVIPIDSYISGICSEEGAPSYPFSRPPFATTLPLFT